MNHTPIPYFNGVDKDNPARLIPETRCSDASNVMFEELLVKSRFGYGLFSEVSDPVMGIIFYQRPYDQYSSYLVVATTRDLYSYDVSSGKMMLRTRSYSTGTAAVPKDSVTVTGLGTAWNTLTGEETYAQIGFGSTDMNAITTWHDIKAYTGATTITLDTAVTATVTAGAYVIRQRYGGTIDDHVFFATPYDNSISDKCLLVTNGIDNIQYWTGTGAFSDLKASASLECDLTFGSVSVATADASSLYPNMVVSGTGADTTIATVGTTSFTIAKTATETESKYLNFVGNAPNIAKHIAYFGSVGFEHTITCNVTESGEPRPMTVEMSDGGYIIWNGTYYDLLNTPGDLQGVAALQDRLVFYKTDSTSEAWFTGGGNEDPLNFVQDKIHVGTMAMRTVQRVEDYHIFASLKGIYAYDGITEHPIGSGVVKHFLSNIGKSNASRAFSFLIQRLKLYCLFIPTGIGEEDYPNLGLIYNYEEKSWSIWQFSHDIYCFGKWKQTIAPTYAEIAALNLTWNDYAAETARWRDLVVENDDETFLLGAIDGKIYNFNESFTDDAGTPILSTFTTRDYPLNDQKHAERLAELVLGFRDQDAGQINVRASVDFGETWSDYILVDMDSPNSYYEEIVNFIMRGVQVRFQIESYLGSSFSIENMIIGWNNMGVRR